MRHLVRGLLCWLALLGALEITGAADAKDPQACNPFAACATPYHTWTFVPVAGAVCGTPGTTAGFFINPTPSSRKLLIAFSGGGACFHQGDCRARDLGGFDPAGIVKEIEQFATFDRTNAENVFFDYNFIWVPYCTGDFHSGGNVAPYGIQHMGYANVGKYLERIVPAYRDVTQVVVTGESAGSYGATFNYDRIHRAFGAEARVDLIADSGPYLPPPYMSSAMQAAIDANWGFRANMPAACRRCTISWHELYPYLSEFWPNDRISLLSNLRDESVRSRFALYGPLPTLDAYAAALTVLANTIIEPLPNFRVFYVPQEGHGVLLRADERQLIVAGVSLDQFLRQQLDSDPAWSNVPPSPPARTGPVARPRPTPGHSPPRPRPTTIPRDVVTPTRTKTAIVDAPASVSVIDPDNDAAAIEPTRNYDLLRRVPGLNVVQLSARDVSIASRQSAGVIASGELALLDGQSLYEEFFGVLWDEVPVQPESIGQIEVVRGPASAVWGANAVDGVINIITKPPRETIGTSVTLAGGLVDRAGGSRQADGPGGAFGTHVSLTEAAGPRLFYRFSAGYDTSPPYSRPVGPVPRSRHPLDDRLPTGGAEYPSDQTGQLGAFENRGTRQPEIDARVDQEVGTGGQLTYIAGWAGSEGIIDTGFGPFGMQRGSFTASAGVVYTRDRLKIDVFTHVLDVTATNLLLSDGLTISVLPNVDASALRRLVPDDGFKTQRYDTEVSHSTEVAGRHYLTYGGSARQNHFDISLAPAARHRSEFASYLQDELSLDRFRVTAGGRLDAVSNRDRPVFSSRLAVAFELSRSDAIRASFNRAFRPPSAVENDLDQRTFAPPGVCCDLRGLIRPARVQAPDVVPFVLQPFPLIVEDVGNPQLKEASLDAYELAYTRTVGWHTLISVAAYEADSRNDILFTSLLPGIEHPTGLAGIDFYTPGNPPPGVPASLMTFLAQVPADFGGPIKLPRTVGRYLNVAGTKNSGLEASLDHAFTPRVKAYGNYSFQATPEPREAGADQVATPIGMIAVPPRHRFNLGADLNTNRFLGQVSLHYADEAFDADVMTPDYAGWTSAYLMVNASVGVKWMQGHVVTSLDGTNLSNERIQQHIFGDILRRALFAEVRLHF